MASFLMRAVVMAVCLISAVAGVAQGGDRLGFTLAPSFTKMRDDGALRDWIDYTAVTQGVGFGQIDKEFGGSVGATIFKNRSARAGIEIGLLFSSTTGRDAAGQECTATAGHVSVDVHYAVHLIRPPGPFVPYVGAGLGMDVPFFSLDGEGLDEANTPGSIMASERLGYGFLIAGVDAFVHPSFAFGLRVKYLKARPGTLRVTEAGDERLVGRELPDARSYAQHPDDPAQWKDLHFNREAIVIAVQFTFHQRLLKGPGVSDD